MKEGLLLRLSFRILPPLIGWLTRIWFATCRVRIHGEEHRQNTLGEGRQVIATFWHYSLLVIFQVLREYNAVVMVSASRDGEYIARLAEFFGFTTVRGSRNNQGVKALKDLIRAARSGDHTAMVADGSQGPPRIVQPGSILLASRTGVPILPMAWSASRYLTINSWDRTAFPKLFSRVEYAFGEPLEVPPGIKGEQLEEYRLILEQRLNELYHRMWQLQHKDAH